MGFRIHAEKMNTVFMLPTEIADQHLKLAGALQLRVILYCYRNMTCEIDPTAIAKVLSTTEEDVRDALMFWVELGLLVSDQPSAPAPAKAEPVKPAPPKTPKPDRGEVARRGTECPEIAFLLNEAQHKFGRMLKQSESSVLVWLYDDLGMDAALILMVIEYAVQAGRCNISYIERVARDWVESGVESIADAEKRIVELNNARSAWNIMRSAFGLDSRAPSEAESKLAKQCVLEWKMSRELLKMAYDICVDSIGRYKASYIKTVLTAWHKKGIRTPEELKAAEQETGEKQPKQNKKNGQYYAAYDMSLMDKIIDGD